MREPAAMARAHAPGVRRQQVAVPQAEAWLPTAATQALPRPTAAA
ncbi:hypothetical protein OG349_17370 [Streptomyces sp. NBC_01317]|nr:hypothetical protein OG349_17370 [Streptomyces sp. NBC_01317]